MYKMKLVIVLLMVSALNISNTEAQSVFVRHGLPPVSQPMDLFVADINQDGYPDYATVTNTSGEVAWWENNGQMGFVKHVLRTGLTGARSVRVADLDGDGDNDLVAAGLTVNRIEWYENNGSNEFTTRILDASFKGAHTVEIFDMDLDGDKDVLCSGWDNTAALSELAWFENHGSNNFTKHLISADLDQSPFAAPADFDLDGDIDVVASDEAPGEIYWYENDGNMTFQVHTIDLAFTLAHTVLPRDVDMDGDLDILGAACTSGKLAWYENKGGGVFEKHGLNDLAGAIWLDMGDFDLDGDQDLVAAGMGAQSVVLFTNNGRQQFTSTNLTGSLASGFALNVADMDQDADLDVIAIGYNSNSVVWWENQPNRQALLKSPAWICEGIEPGTYLVANEGSAEIVFCRGLQPDHGIVHPPYCQGLTAHGESLWAAVGASLNVYDVHSGILTNSIRTNTSYIDGLTRQQDVLFFSAPMEGMIFRVNMSGAEVHQLASGLRFPRACAIHPDRSRLMVLDGEDNLDLVEIDLLSGVETARIHTNVQGGGDICYDRAGNAYISSPAEDAIYILRNGSNELELLFEQLSGPRGLVFEDDANELVVAMSGKNQLEQFHVSLSKVNSLEIKNDNEGLVYPNPANEFMNIQLSAPLPADGRMQIFDVQGNVVMTIQVERAQTNIPVQIKEAGLGEGFYVIRIKGTGYQHQLKFMII